MNNYIKIDIVDNDYEKETGRVMDTYIIVIPNDESSLYKEKLKELQEMLRNRHDEENEFTNNYGAIHDYIVENFEVLDILYTEEIEW